MLPLTLAMHNAVIRVLSHLCLLVISSHDSLPLDAGTVLTNLDDIQAWPAQRLQEIHDGA